MKTHIFSVSFAALSTLFMMNSCTTTSQQKTTEPDSHTSKVALDVAGTYRGTLPCADCEGIKTTIVLSPDNTFTSRSEYLSNKGTDKFETEGKYTWNEDGNTITLKDEKNAIQYLVGENTLTQLDQNGKKIEGALAANYLLTKDNYSILGKKWVLVELMGKPVEPFETTKKEAYIMFNDDENRFTATAGCNTISGTFATESFNKLRLGMGMSTMMACPDMTLEDQLKEVLKKADSFTLNGDELALVKGRMAPLAKFKSLMRK